MSGLPLCCCLFLWGSGFSNYDFLKGSLTLLVFLAPGGVGKLWSCTNFYLVSGLHHLNIGKCFKRKSSRAHLGVFLWSWPPEPIYLNYSQCIQLAVFCILSISCSCFQGQSWSDASCSITGESKNLLEEESWITDLLKFIPYLTSPPSKKVFEAIYNEIHIHMQEKP